MSSSEHYCVVITRPEVQAVVWAEQLVQLGFTARRLNLLEICPLVEESQTRAIKNKVLDFDLYQKVIFVSQNAVEHGMRWLEDYWPQLPMGIDYFAIGATTAKRLATYGVAVKDLAVSESGSMTSEELLKAEQLQHINGEKILIFRGVGGRGHLAEELRKRGAYVDYCEVYSRNLPVTAQAQLSELFNATAQGTEECIISLHSGESLHNLIALIGTLSEIDAVVAKRQVQESLLLVPSQRVLNAAKELGFTRLICAENATDKAMTAALLDYCRTHECISLQD
jgi:uroporphyrinogen-III synthase